MRRDRDLTFREDLAAAGRVFDIDFTVDATPSADLSVRGLEALTRRLDARAVAPELEPAFADTPLRPDLDAGEDFDFRRNRRWVLLIASTSSSFRMPCHPAMP
ncbi:hypothetical protein [Stieleria maiorica]|uniref:hypothetical protein n=1 Tax=Stieleria maiorica TaxID=2795974 RepID=UPI0028F4043E|nr:hypothetical protein [Stieleria maiorica]